MTPPSAVTPHARLHVIDFLRGIAILAVIWHHASSLVTYPPDVVPGIFRAVPWLRGGWFGVNLFFILSGFVLYLPYAQARRQMRTADDATAFARHRASRLLPLYYCSTAVLLIFNFWPADTNDALVQTLTLATMTFGFSTATFFAKPNWVLWSLAVEVWFTLLFVPLAIAMRRYPLPIVTTAVLLLSLGVRLAGTLWTAADIPGHQLNPVRDSVLGRLDDFLVGMLLATWYARRRAAGTSSAARRFVLIVAGIAVATVGPFLWELAAVHALPKWPVIFANNAFQLGAVLVMIALLDGTAPARRSYPVLAVEMLGMMCYSLYIWHGVLLARMQPAPTLSGVAGYAAALLTLSALTYRYIEFGRVRDWRQLLPKSG